MEISRSHGIKLHSCHLHYYVMVDWSLYIDEEDFFCIGEDLDLSEQLTLAGAICGIKSMGASNSVLGCILDIVTKRPIWVSQGLMSIYQSLREYKEHLEFDSVFCCGDDSEHQHLEEIDQSAFAFILSHHKDKILKCTIKANVSVSIDNTTLFYERSLRILSVKGNKVHIVLCWFSPSSHQKRGNFRLIFDHSFFYYRPRYTPIYWMKRPCVTLNKREQWIIQLSSQGLSEIEIANILHVSLPRLKSIKKEMFCKMKVKNICQAQRRAFLYQMLTHKF